MSGDSTIRETLTVSLALAIIVGAAIVAALANYDLGETINATTAQPAGSPAAQR